MWGVKTGRSGAPHILAFNLSPLTFNLLPTHFALSEHVEREALWHKVRPAFVCQHAAYGGVFNRAHAPTFGANHLHGRIAILHPLVLGGAYTKLLVQFLYQTCIFQQRKCIVNGSSAYGQFGERSAQFLYREILQTTGGTHNAVPLWRMLHTMLGEIRTQLLCPFLNDMLFALWHSA